MSNEDRAPTQHPPRGPQAPPQAPVDSPDAPRADPPCEISTGQPRDVMLSGRGFRQPIIKCMAEKGWVVIRAGDERDAGLWVELSIRTSLLIYWLNALGYTVHPPRE
jgi:hypothetical protein